MRVREAESPSRRAGKPVSGTGFEWWYRQQLQLPLGASNLCAIEAAFPLLAPPNAIPADPTSVCLCWLASPDAITAYPTSIRPPLQTSVLRCLPLEGQAAGRRSTPW